MMMDGMIVLICNSFTKKQGQSPPTNTYGSLWLQKSSQSTADTGHLWSFSKAFRLFFYRSNPQKPHGLSLARHTIPYPEREWVCYCHVLLVSRPRAASSKGMLVLILSSAKDHNSHKKAKIQLGETEFLEYFKVEVANWIDGENWNCRKE